MAATFFKNVWGDSAFVTRALPVFIALSALGNVFAQSFAMPRGECVGDPYGSRLSGGEVTDIVL